MNNKGVALLAIIGSCTLIVLSSPSSAIPPAPNETPYPTQNPLEIFSRELLNSSGQDEFLFKVTQTLQKSETPDQLSQKISIN